jgi:D-threo-aldose 1-dehydrogenase
MKFPSIIFGTSTLGNLYQELSYQTKKELIHAYIKATPNAIPMFDTAGKYGAGLALEVLAKSLHELNILTSNVYISNKLGWYRTKLETPEPTFEKGVWANLQHDAVQKISYKGILECYQQGNELLGNYPSQFASIHDPDEYLAAAINEKDAEKRENDIIEAYYALQELKEKGEIIGIGVGAKNWTSIQKIANKIKLDWVMFANSLTLKTHPIELIQFIQLLHNNGVYVINSALFNGGFLVGNNFYNYVEVNPLTQEGKALLEWRNKFFTICKLYNITPAEAAFNFGSSIYGVSSVAISTSLPEKIAVNINMANKKIPTAFWQHLKQENLIEEHVL